MVIEEISSEEELKNILSAHEKVLIDFYADWCGPCRMMGPIMEEICEDMIDMIKVYKVNVDETPELSDKFEISSIPTVIYFQNGELVEKIVGLRPKEEILKLCEA